ncbi:MAG: hypothetical protein HGJ93_07585 [Desulfosarcina sp.]|nr:hypothetical protein [Desulfosarcina sp.]MBC2765804.1 hypothetical protein [Desulfosarcina sp.]
MAMNIVEKIDDRVSVNHVLISVSDKSGLETFVPRLLAINTDIQIFSTGGTFARLREILGDVANLYPFKETIAKAGVTPEQARGNIDIGGPCMIRASAKNFIRVASVVDPGDYGQIADEMAADKGSISLALRYRLARKAFAHTAAYDAAIAGYLDGTAFAAVEDGYQAQDE